MQGLLSAKVPALQTSLAKAALSSSLKAGTTVLRPSAPTFKTSATSSVSSVVTAAAVAEAPLPVETVKRNSAPSTPRHQDAAVVMKFLIPANSVGSFLGKEGAHAQTVRETTGVQVHVTRPGVAVYNPKDRMLILSGDTAQACKLAFNVLLQTVAADGGLDRLHRASGPNAGKLFLRQIIPGICAGKVLGPGGEQILQISQTTGCAVVVEAKPDNAAFVPFRFVNYSAPDTGSLTQAVDQVMDLILLEPKYQASMKEIQSICFKVVEVPEKKAGNLLGPGGAHIKALQEVLRCKMGICESSTKPGSRYVSIWGAPANVKVAVDLVNVATGQISKIDTGNGGGGGFSSNYSDTASIAGSYIEQ